MIDFIVYGLPSVGLLGQSVLFFFGMFVGALTQFFIMKGDNHE